MDRKKYNLKVYSATTAVPNTYLGNAIPTTVILAKDGTNAARMQEVVIINLQKSSRS